MGIRFYMASPLAYSCSDILRGLYFEYICFFLRIKGSTGKQVI
jgi:hypothetical protein